MGHGFNSKLINYQRVSRFCFLLFYGFCLKQKRSSCLRVESMAMSGHCWCNWLSPLPATLLLFQSCLAMAWLNIPITLILTISTPCYNIYIFYYNTLYKMHVAELSADPGQRKGERVRAERLWTQKPSTTTTTTIAAARRKNSQNHHFLWVSEVTLGIFGVQFWGFSVLHCHGVFPSGDQQQQQKRLQQQEEKPAKIHSSSKKKKQPNHHFLWVSEVTLGIFGVQFWGFSVLHCHGVFPSGD